MDSSFINLQPAGMVSPLSKSDIKPKAANADQTKPSKEASLQLGDQFKAPALSQGSASQAELIQTEIYTPETLSGALQQSSFENLRDLFFSLQKLDPKLLSSEQKAQVLASFIQGLSVENQHLAQSLGLNQLDPQNLDILMETLHGHLCDLVETEQAAPEAMAAADKVLRQNFMQQADAVDALRRNIGILTLQSSMGFLSPQEFALEREQMIAALPSEQKKIAEAMGLGAMSLQSMIHLEEMAGDLGKAVVSMQENALIKKIEVTSRAILDAPALATDQLLDLKSGKSELVAPIETAREEVLARHQLEHQALENKFNVNELVLKAGVADPEGMQFDQGLEGFLRLLDQEGEDVRKLVQQVLRHQPLNQIDLTAKNNYILAQILGSDEQQSNALIQALQTLQRGGALKQEGQAVLEKVGIFVRDGKAYNLANKNILQAQNLALFAKIAQHMLTTRLAGATTSELAMQTKQPVIIEQFRALESLKDMRGQIESNTADLRREREALAETNTQIVQAQLVVSQTGTEFEQAQDNLESLAFVFQILNQQGLAGLNALTSEQLNKANAVLSQWGASLERKAGQVQLQFQGRTVSSDKVLQQVSQWLDALKQKVDHSQSRFQESASQLKELQQKAERQAERLDEQAKDLKSLLDTYKQNLETFKAQGIPALLALRNNPAAWAALSSEEKEMVENLLLQGHRELDLGLSITALAEQELAAVFAEIERTKALSRQSTDLLSKLNADSGLEKDTQELIAKAQAIEMQLAKTPHMESETAGKLASEWLAQLSKFEGELKAQLRQEIQNAQFEHALSAQNYQKALRRLEYHTRQLKALDLRQTERLEQVLKGSLSRVSKEISVLIPQTTEGMRP
ncbi:hypothetical protein COW36_06375 [bacterium (Candidatus Blackallbacteria) CG17_big_fil_post_rev_8_21_14_2_50_48_46]|uniref:Uncharacterized protein n=1 Tax=bacterium (Candidatus Blackallbacteria) CG17_big_fil_post_rev_8_21_14_2_50_48_46 TaxID=2014261 RepID=A0A2M7G7T5_9BACT|nr:MAG: hypothetical protein COW64_17205 [bacterium (Candidatus Blackallbacteria) CG18_big_fil_WC_8_21_14_2_50_49_26]PIW18151.1 MAG: hypothetical protein COW36_06375 [bacterium (Candidatus Blackallbacteria) CG17_big_fil_post_rev_8_21_14_2_50_48_46]PIW47014.1 MAG: hypothetical protein COW20_13870 [bacterium (Candidatus Blackallbacteria) CG13_big_fil_rev_8_21_14_2_50_49_14]